MRLIRTGWQQGLYKASLRLVNGFITWHCGMRKLETIWNISQLEYCRVFSNWEELKTIEHLLYKCLAFCRLTLIGTGWLLGLNKASLRLVNGYVTMALRDEKAGNYLEYIPAGLLQGI